MAAGSWQLMLVGWCSVVAGVLLGLLGVALVAVLFSGGNAPLGGAGLYGFLTLVLGPLLILGGPAVSFSAIKLMGGHAWPRPVLEIVWWAVFVVVLAWLVIAGVTKREIRSDDMIRGALYLAFLCAPAVYMAILLRSDAIRRALH